MYKKMLFYVDILINNLSLIKFLPSVVTYKHHFVPGVTYPLDKKPRFLPQRKLNFRYCNYFI